MKLHIPQTVEIHGLPSLPTDWRWVRFEEVCQRVSVGHVGPTTEYFCEPVCGVLFLRSQNVRPGHLDVSSAAAITPTFHKKLKKSQLRAGDILFVRVGANRGDCCVVPVGLGEINCANIVFARPNHPNGFHAYFFQSTLGRSLLLSASVGAAQGVINTSSVASMPVPQPPLPIQERIAGILSAYDELIENSQRRIKILESMARGLYREWFRSSDSDRFISADQLVNDGILEINDGYRAKNSELGDIGLPFARAGNVNNGFLFDNADILAEQYLSRVGSKRSVNGDVVFTSKGTVGRFARVRERTPEFVYSPQLCFWRVRKMEALSPNYLYRWMQSREFLDQVDCVKGSTDMADYVSLSNQRKMIVRIPCAAAQKKGDTALGPVEDLIGALDDQIQNLRRTRNLLLPRLLSGQIDLKVD